MMNLTRTFHTPTTASAIDAPSTGVFPKNTRLHSATMRGRIFRKEASASIASLALSLRRGMKCSG